MFSVFTFDFLCLFVPSLKLDFLESACGKSVSCMQLNCFTSLRLFEMVFQKNNKKTKQNGEIFVLLEPV